MRLDEHECGRELNPPGEILARLAFVAMVGFGVAGAVFLAAGVAHRDLRRAATGTLFVISAVGIFRWLRRSGRLVPVVASLKNLRLDSPPAREVTLENLREELRATEQKRGTPAFDPWEVQRLRQLIVNFERDRSNPPPPTI